MSLKYFTNTKTSAGSIVAHMLRQTTTKFTCRQRPAGSGVFNRLDCPPFERRAKLCFMAGFQQAL